ncbi:MAG: DUF3857 domain-containing protein [Bacteroidota bacterium]
MPKASFAQGEIDAVVEKQIKEYTLQEDGEFDYHLYKQVKLLTYNAIHKIYGETFVLYNSDYQKFTLGYSFTFMKDGTRITTPENAFNEVLPRFAANAPAYNNLKEKVITHTGLEIGSTIVLDYSITSSEAFLPGLMVVDGLTDLSPVNALTVVVRIPKGKDWTYKILNTTASLNMKIEGDFKVYRWHFTNIPAHIYEPNQPDATDFLPLMMFSSLKSHKDLSKWLKKQPCFSESCSAAMIEKAQQIRKEEKEDLKVALKLQDLVVNELSLISIPANIAGFRGRAPQEVWASAYGTPLEKAVLLSALLKAVNIDAEILTIVPESYSMDMPNPFLWDDFYIAFDPGTRGRKPIYLSVREINDKDLPLKIGKRKLLPIPGLSGIRENNSSNELNHASLEKEIKMDEKGDVTGGVSVRKEGKYLFMSLPVPEKGLETWHMGELTVMRDSPFEIAYPLSEEIKLSIELPANVELISTITDKQIDNKAGKFDFKIAKEGNKLTIQKNITLMNLTHDPAAYSDFRDLVNTWSSKMFKEVIFIIK